MFDNILITSLSQQLLSNLYSDLMLCNTSGTFRILAYSTLCFFRCMHIQAYSALLRLNHAYWDIIKAYSGLFRHILHPVWLSYSQLCHILSPGIFSTRDLFNTLRNVDQTYSEPYHRALFSHIQNLRQHLHTQKPGILTIMEYSEPFHNCIPMHI